MNQCHGKNKDGSRCHRLTNEQYCWQHRVTIYTIPTCPFCIKAKNLLKIKKLPYKEIIVNDTLKKKLIQATGHKTVPQIFIGGKFIGGYTELQRILK